MTAIAPAPSAQPAAMPAPTADQFETVACYLCGSSSTEHFLFAEDDLTGKPGRFSFVTCKGCGLRYQNPRLTVEHVKAYYDDEYIAHRKKSDWGILTGFFNWAMSRHDRQKDKLVSRFVRLERKQRGPRRGLRRRHFPAAHARDAWRGSRAWTSRISAPIRRSPASTFAAACSMSRISARSDSTDHDVALPRARLRPDAHAAHGARSARADGRLIIEVPRLDSTTFRLYGDRWPGLQAPQHTVLYDRAKIIAAVEASGLEVVEYLPYGAFPAFFYFFTGAAFKVLRGKGLNLARAIYPYFIGQILFSPILAFEKQLNFAMQTVVCRRRS